MRRQGDLRSFLRQQIAEGKARKQPAKAAPPPPRPGHTPGAWPTGSQRPGPIAPQPPGAWAAALERYSDWLATAAQPEKPEPGQHCPCGCTPETKETR
jgi:hypothetical protein